MGALMLLSLSATAVVASEKPCIAVFNYHDFGPQVMSSDLLGMEWFQWEQHGDPRPKDYPVKVVVYAGYSLAEIEGRYPVIPEKEQDHRYVHLADAKTFVDTSLDTLHRMDPTAEQFTELMADLHQLKQTLNTCY
ncbi:hypothetical protein C9I90_04435 [Photobacterium aphoticum]|uniref:Uncharacterized protein n=2 Tax=Photobacterium aphoticum TaxID=754436 RepID=A0A0J1GPR1_9GAMM|nr:hypothetical protein ABT58_04680 [Photobacterium aphoticum]PSU59319.1 hypothetical protein C9I90_04435 [Photobacterium aphoticum]